MATIKDVAKCAGVSLGTVSNVLNGKTNNEELIRRVEKAMDELSYRPDAVARSLKITQSMLIGVILPDIQHKEYTDFLYEVEHRVKEKGYSVLVKLSRNNKLVEKKCIEACLQQSVAGIILYSNTTGCGESLSRGTNGTTPNILISKRDISNYLGDRIFLNYEKAFEKAMIEFHRKDISKVGLIMENEMLENKDFLNIYYSFCSSQEIQKVVESCQEQGYQAFFELYTSYPQIQAIVAGSHLIGTGVKKAMETLGVTNVPVVTMKESSWIEDAGYYEAQLSISQKKVASEALKQILDAMERPNVHESKTHVVQGEYDRIPSIESGIKKNISELRFAMFECSSGRSLQMLSRIYEKVCGKKIVFEFFKYRELEELLYNNSNKNDSYFDGFMMDITWLDGLIESGGVENLDSFREKNQEYFRGFIDGVLKDYGMYVESLYAIPFVSGAQILFYQKDLFENKNLQFRFKRLYGEELLPPKTWTQFNLIAEFFTKEYNDQSPVKYGASLPKGENIFTTISFLSHLWAYDSEIFDEKGRVVLNNSNSVAALKNFIASYKYTSGKPLSSWNDVADEFSTGASAMTILYDSDAGGINNYTKSKVAGNLGYTLVPGGCPVLGGWSLGLNRYSKNLEDAKKFLLWSCGNQNCVPLSLLGGSTLRKDFYVRSDLENLEPWKALILKIYQQSKKRVMPEILDESRLKNNLYTKLIPNEIEKVLQGKINEEQAIMNLQDIIQSMIWCI